MLIVSREEKKYLIDYITYKQHTIKLSNIMIEDSHNGSDGYTIRSLYFDSIYDKDYQEKMDGIELRRKIRLRIYNTKQQDAKLEIKQKQGSYQLKRTLTISKEDAIALIQGNYDVLLKYPEDFALECFGIMNKYHYLPKTIVEYKRKAYIAKENKIRITFDHQIKCNEVNFDLFDENLTMYPVFPGDLVVLEVKYNGFLLSYLKDLINSINSQELSVSKYILARHVTCKTHL